MTPARGIAPRRVVLAVLGVALAVSISLAELSVTVLAALLIVDGLRRGRPRAASRALPLWWPVVAFVAWSVVAALASERPLESLRSTKSLVWLATVWIVFHALEDRRTTRAFAALVFAAVSVVALVGVVQVLACPAAPPGGILQLVFHKCGRARGFYSIYMTLGGVLLLVMVTALPWLLRGAMRWTWIGAGWLITAAALALTQVRGAWVGLAVGAGVVVVVTRRRGVIVAIAALALAAVAVSPTIRARFKLDEPAADRLAMLAGGLAIARDHPLTGIGPGQVKHVYPAYAPPYAFRHSTSHLHDTPVQILVEVGVIGFALWAAIFVVFFRRTWQIYRRLPPEAVDDRALVLGAAAAVAAFLVAGLFEYNFGDTEVVLVACAVMALPFVVERLRATPEQP